MANYVIINASGAELTDVNAGGDDVAAGTISANLTLDDAELAAVCALDNVAVMNASASTAEKAAVGELLVGAASGTNSVYTASSSTGLFASETLDPVDLVTALAAGKAIIAQSLTQKERDLAARVLSGGTQSGKRTS